MNSKKYIELQTENIESFVIPIEKVKELKFLPLKTRKSLKSGKFVDDSFYKNYITDVVLVIDDCDKTMKALYYEDTETDAEINITLRTDFTHIIFHNDGKETKYAMQWFGSNEYENEGANWEHFEYLDHDVYPEEKVSEWIFTSNINNYGKFLSSTKTK